MPTRVLVVDDNFYNVRLLEARLQAERYAVATALSGEEALAKLAQHQPDIVLLDIMMPGLDGYEVCRRIRQHPATARLPVVMVTALDKASDRDAALAAGADDFFTKPLEVEALFAAMRRLLHDRSAAEALPAEAS
jgi:two-component system cell cycle response regulator